MRTLTHVMQAQRRYTLMLSPSTPRNIGELLAVELGRTIGERYRIERTLGNGAMGVVFAARHVALDEMVALKFMRPELRQHAEMRRRFAREAKAAAKIRSDHVAAVLDVGTDEALGPYIVMELLEGEDLSEVLSRGPLPLAVACGYILQACEGLALAHTLGIVHRDLKPSNLYLTHRGDLEILKLLDFGVSKAALSGMVFGGELSVSDTAHMLGSPLYMSPEQIRATTAVDQRSDVWALGVVLHELVTGQSPFNADSIAEVCARILEGSPATLAGSGVPGLDALQPVIARCLSRDARDRYADVGALAVAIEPFAEPRSRLHSGRTQSVLRHHRLDSKTDLRESGLYAPIAKLRDHASGIASAPTVSDSSKGAVSMRDEPSATIDSSRLLVRRRVAWGWLGMGLLALIASLVLLDATLQPLTRQEELDARSGSVASSALVVNLPTLPNTAPVVDALKASPPVEASGAMVTSLDVGGQPTAAPASRPPAASRLPVTWRAPARASRPEAPDALAHQSEVGEGPSLEAAPALEQPSRTAPKPRVRLVQERSPRLVE